jgi:tetratricopeptide (TPR) repeat protein
MSPRPAIAAIVAVVAAIILTTPTTAADRDTPIKLNTWLIPRKAANAQVRASLYVQKSPDFVLWDRDTKITPGAAGYIYYLERADGNRLLLADQNEGARGWVRGDSVVQIAEAEAYFSSQIQANPRDAFALMMRGVVRFENEDLDRALTDLDSSLNLEPNSVPALIARAAARQWKNRLDEAITDATRAIELNPANCYALVERGVFHYDKKDYDKALEEFDAAAGQGFKGAVIHVGRGWIYLQRRDFKKAQAEFKEALRIDPKHPDAYSGVASIYLARGDVKKALLVLDEAIQIDPQSADSHGNRAVILLATGKYDKAIDDLDAVVQLAPTSARALRERAWIWATCPMEKVRNGAEAVKSATKACELTGWTDARSVMTLAAAYSEAGKFDEAINWQKKAIELLPDRSAEKHEYEKSLERYVKKKPYRHLNLLGEMGIHSAHVPAKKSE